MKVLDKAVTTLKQEGIDSFIDKTKRKILAIYQQSTFRPYLIEKEFSGQIFHLLISDLFAHNCYAKPNDWPELRWIQENLLEEGDLVADCGANIGFTGLFFSRCVRNSGKVIGFEALPANISAALKNIELNDINNFTIEGYAVGAEKGTTKFLAHPNGAVGDRDDMKVIEVPLIALDDFFINETPSFLKIDVEGYEIEVLKGAKNVLASRPKLDIEIHCLLFDNCLDSVKKIFELLDLSSYKTYIQLVVDGPILEYSSNEHTPEKISEYSNVHLFAAPIN